MRRVSGLLGRGGLRRGSDPLGHLTLGLGAHVDGVVRGGWRQEADGRKLVAVAEGLLTEETVVLDWYEAGVGALALVDEEVKVGRALVRVRRDEASEVVVNVKLEEGLEGGESKRGSQVSNHRFESLLGRNVAPENKLVLLVVTGAEGWQAGEFTRDVGDGEVAWVADFVLRDG